MTRLSVALMIHPRRMDNLVPTVAAMQGAPLTVVADVDSVGIWPTARRAWLAWLPGATHHMVIQDDLAFTPSFYHGMVKAISAVPDQIVCAYSASGKAVEARGRGDHWYLWDSGAYGQAMVMPVPLIRDWIAWDRTHVDPACPHDDTRVVLYAMAHKRPIWMTVPSLVQHAGHAESLVGHHGPRRTSPSFDPAFDPAAADWTPPAAPLHVRTSLRSYYGAKYLQENL